MTQDFPGGSAVKKSTGNAGSIPGSGSPGIGNGNPVQYSCLETSMNRGAWLAKSMGSQRAGHNRATEDTKHLSKLAAYAKT